MKKRHSVSETKRVSYELCKFDNNQNFFVCFNLFLSIQWPPSETIQEKLIWMWVVFVRKKCTPWVFVYKPLMAFNLTFFGESCFVFDFWLADKRSWGSDGWRCAKNSKITFLGFFLYEKLSAGKVQFHQ